ncbi:MAG: hypothetical protein ACON5F_15955 [Jejuia sp.]
MKSNIFFTCFIISMALLLFNCVQTTHPKTILFKLDMRSETDLSKVGIRGNTSPLSWNETFYLTDNNNDSIYEGEIQLNSASYDIEFKFVNQTENFELQDKPNRSIRFEYKPETIVYSAIFNNSKDIKTQKK